MTPRSAPRPDQEIWDLMRDLVLDDDRRREVERTTGLSFWRARSLRRIAERELRMSDLAGVLSVSAPQATILVNFLEAEGLVERASDPADGRARIVRTTPRGRHVVEQITTVLRRPPAGTRRLSADEQRELLRLLRQLRD